MSKRARYVLELRLIRLDPNGAAPEVKASIAQVAELITERDRLRAENARLRAVIEDLHATVMAWHGTDDEEAWRIYSEHAPELATYRALLADAEGPRNADDATLMSILNAAQYHQKRAFAYRDALAKYGAHLDDCIDDPCTCGLSTVLAEAGGHASVNPTLTLGATYESERY